MIAVDGRPIGAAARTTYLLLHKPAGVTSTTRDRHADTTVLDLVPTALVPDGARLYPVGRLDQDSEGLLLLTNDGGWSERVLHPRYGVEREYALALAAPLDREQVAALERGHRARRGACATLHHLRPMTATEVAQADGPAAPPAPPDLTWYRATLAPGLEAPAAPDVRRRRAPRSSASSGSGSARSGSTACEADASARSRRPRSAGSPGADGRSRDPNPAPARPR